MSTLTNSLNPPRKRTFNGQKAVRLAGKIWFLVATPGLWLFALYIFGFYGLTAIQGNHARWAEVLPEGFVPNDPVGNGALITHILFAFFINVGGPLQFIPTFRKKYPKFHRLNGRLFVFSGLAASLAGVYMTWVRGFVGGPILGMGNTLAGVLILLFSIWAIRTARQKQFHRHQQWALRLFLVCNVTWFFRVGMFLWIVLTGGAGVDFETFTGPFVTFWAYGQFIIPLLLAELYFYGLKSHKSRAQYIISGVLLGATLLMMAGILIVTVGGWIPRVVG
ncbi:MAG: DUF2306 domain-containing protein [Bacteroidota bacterium]